MASQVYYYVQNLWPFTAFRFDDLKESDKLVKNLSLPNHTKEFIFAVREPETQSVIYILCVQNLSERSARDAEHLVREVKPDAVVVQVGHGFDEEIRSKEIELKNGVNEPVPTSWFGVLKRCFVHKINREEYEVVAGGLVMREIFGVGLHGHFAAAKRAADEVGSSFLLLESPFTKNTGGGGGGNADVSVDKSEWGSKFGAFACQPSNLVSQKVVGSFVSTGSRRLFVWNDSNLKAVRSFSTHLTKSINGDSRQLLPIQDYEAPAFAQPIYSLLLDLHNIFSDIPTIGTALAHAQRMLNDVSKGETVDSKLVSEVYAFQIAVEGLRIALNNAGRVPIGPPDANKPFSDLGEEEKSHALVAQALKSQAKKFRSIVAVMDASSLAGLRKYWATSVPTEVKGILEELIINCNDDDELGSSYNIRKRLLTNKPVVAVGAGATAIIGASSLSKAIPASTVMKVVTYKVPASLKLLLSQTQKAVAIATKSVGPAKVLSPGVKAAASAEKIRVVAHSVIASVEKTSLSAMRTAFYEIMRKRRVRIGVLPWVTFGCSIATCSSLLMYGDGIECVAESVPAAPSIASLGRGIQSLQLASQSVRQAESSKIKMSIDALMYRFKNAK